MNDVEALRASPECAGQSTTGAARLAPTDARSAFELPAGIYLYSHAVGCLPKVSREGASAYFEQWASGGGNAWDPWLGEVTRFNTALANLLSANVEDVCPQINLSAALTKIIMALPKREGRNRIVLSLLDFPTIGFVAQQAERLGYEIVFAENPVAAASSSRTAAEMPPPQNEIDPRLALIDERCALVIWTHAYPNTGTAIEPPTREQIHGAYLCVDIAQSAGVLPIDVAQWDADFVIGSCVKWLCGGPGAGYLWVRPNLTPQLEPLDVGWFSHARPFDFDITSFQYAPDAARFWGGTPSILPYAVASRSIHVILQYGVALIRAHNLALSRIVTDAALAKGIKVVSPTVGEAFMPSNAGATNGSPTQSGTVVLDFGDNLEAKQRLNGAGVHCDSRKYGVRISPHIYNTVEEMAELSKLL
ncbi:MAG: aminotransferase class V-fold PLP-dependent enzyme [bacterium]|nr:aminotransferase class V-fold PLP-dependent enzyme [bacterium]